MRALKQTTKFTGVLAEPLRVELPREPNLLTELDGRARYQQELRALDERVERALEERWLALRAHYGLPEDCSWEGVARFLAYEFVPGFRGPEEEEDPGPIALEPSLRDRKAKAGRKRTWTFDKVEELELAVRERVERDGLTVLQACEALSSEPRWRPAAGNTLRTRLYSFPGGVRKYRTEKRTVRK